MTDVLVLPQSLACGEAKAGLSAPTVGGRRGIGPMGGPQHRCAEASFGRGHVSSRAEGGYRHMLGLCCASQVLERITWPSECVRSLGDDNRRE